MSEHTVTRPLSPRERRRLKPRPPRDLELSTTVRHAGSRLDCARPECVA